MPIRHAGAGGRQQTPLALSHYELAWKPHLDRPRGRLYLAGRDDAELLHQV
jgi:hypothetical protein